MNGVYLNLLLKEIKDSIISQYIEGVYIKERLVQIILRDRALFISLFPDTTGLYLSKRELHFEELESISQTLKGCQITEINQSNFTPVLALELQKSYPHIEHFKLIISLYRAAPNLSIKSASWTRNLFPRIIKKGEKKSFLDITLDDLNNKKNLVEEFSGVDKYLSQELDAKNLERLKTMLQGIMARPRLVSISPLKISFFATEYLKEFTSLNELLKEGIERFVAEKEKISFQTHKLALIRRLEKKIERLKKGLRTDEEIDEYRIAGELILINIGKIKKNMTDVGLFNPYTQDETAIRLDPTKTPPANAQAYFRKYKKLKRGKPLLIKKIEALENERKRIEKLTMPLALETKTPALKEIAKPKPFREFILPSGAKVYVGKSARSNEALTFKFARPDDYFFHTRGYEGAHVILKAKITKDQKPRRDDIEAAASIAAYFSKAKNQKNVLVSYIQRKYLKKNKRGRPGSVILMREEVIFAAPKLPT